MSKKCYRLYFLINPGIWGCRVFCPLHRCLIYSPTAHDRSTVYSLYLCMLESSGGTDISKYFSVLVGVWGPAFKWKISGLNQLRVTTMSNFPLSLQSGLRLRKSHDLWVKLTKPVVSRHIQFKENSCFKWIFVRYFQTFPYMWTVSLPI